MEEQYSERPLVKWLSSDTRPEETEQPLLFKL